VNAPFERVLLGGAVYRHAGAKAVAIAGGRIAWIGTRDEALDLTDDRTELVDLGAGAILPGFIDAHTHPIHTGLAEIGWRIDLAGCSRAESLERIRAAAVDRGAGEWIVAWGWDESGWEDRAYLTRQELDRVAPAAPVAAIRTDGHLVAANDPAIRRAAAWLGGGIPGAVDAERGHLREEAAWRLLARIQPDASTLREALRGAARLCHRLGIAGIHAMVEPEHLPIYAAEAESLRLRVTVCPQIDALEQLMSEGRRTGDGGAWLRYGGLKIFADGSIGARNAAVSALYGDGEGGVGALNHADEILRGFLGRAEIGGWQTVIHAIGDRAIEQVLRAHAAVGTSRALRHRIEHFELPVPGQVERARDLGLSVCMQPNFTGNWSGPGSMYERRLGPARDRASNPLRAVHAAGLPLALGSDGMPMGPLYGLHWAVVGRYPDQRLAIDAAIDAYTAGGASLGFTEGETGNLCVGAWADLVVLDEDPTLDPHRIADRAVEATFVAGETVYCRNE